MSASGHTRTAPACQGFGAKDKLSCVHGCDEACPRQPPEPEALGFLARREPRLELRDAVSQLLQPHELALPGAFGSSWRTIPLDYRVFARMR